MPQNESGASAPMTTEQMQAWIKENDAKIKRYQAALDPLRRLRDITKSASRTISSLTKEDIVTYLKAPNANESNLRNASWYIFYRNQIYQRIIMYFASLFCFEARTIIPNYDLIKPESDDKILKSYNDTLSMMNGWNINDEFFKVVTTCLLQDVSYNVAYYEKDGLQLIPLPPDYCRIYGQYSTGDFAFALNMGYFRGTNNYLVDAWGEPFKTMWRNFEREGSAGIWQLVPDEYAACFKYRNYDWQSVIPVFSGLLGDLINLNDISDVQAVADKQEIYKLLWVELETITGTKIPDDWKVNPEIVIEYFERMINEALPDYASAAIVPGKLNVIDFSSTDKTNETNKVLKGTKSVLNTSGGAQILNSAEISGTTAFNAAIKADTEFAISTLLPQIEGWFNRIMEYAVSKPSKIHFFHVGRLNKDDLRKELLENAQYSLPTKLSIMSLNGFTEMDTLALNHLENNILDLGNKFNSPLQSSYTTSNVVGRPVSDDSDLTDDGEASRDKSDRL